MQSNGFSENKKLPMQVGMANHNLGEKTEKISAFPRKKLQFLKMLTLLLSAGLIFKSEKKKRQEKLKFVSKVKISVAVKSETFISNYCQSYS